MGRKSGLPDPPVHPGTRRRFAAVPLRLIAGPVFDWMLRDVARKQKHPIGSMMSSKFREDSGRRPKALMVASLLTHESDHRPGHRPDGRPADFQLQRCLPLPGPDTRLMGHPCSDGPQPTSQPGAEKVRFDPDIGSKWQVETTHHQLGGYMDQGGQTGFD